MFEPVTIELKKPIEHGQGQVERLVFNREPVAGDFFDLQPSGWTAGDYGLVISRLTDQPLPVIKRLSVPDFRAAMLRVEAFLSAGQETGSES